MATLLGKCSQCKGNLYNDHGTIKCLLCGWELKDPLERRAWYQANRDEMVQDLLKFGNTKTIKKWGIKIQMIGHLKSTELYKQLTAAVPSPVTTSPTNGLPHLPEFSNDWDPAVQIKWIEAWDRSVGSKDRGK